LKEAKLVQLTFQKNSSLKKAQVLQNWTLSSAVPAVKIIDYPLLGILLSFETAISPSVHSGFRYANNTEDKRVAVDVMVGVYPENKNLGIETLPCGLSVTEFLYPPRLSHIVHNPATLSPTW